MPLQYPLSLADFFDTLPVKNVIARPGRAVTTSETGGGEFIAHNRGARLWHGKVVLDKDHHRFWAATEAVLSLLEEAGASFLLWDVRMRGPIADPDKTLLGAATPVIADVAANNRELDLSGLPAGYVLQRGDLLGFQYGSNPKRYAYHRVVTGDTASLGGTARNIEVTPFLRPGAIVGTFVTLGTPVLKARLSEADYGASRAAISEGGSFNWIQTLR